VRASWQPPSSRNGGVSQHSTCGLVKPADGVLLTVAKARNLRRYAVSRPVRSGVTHDHRRNASLKPEHAEQAERRAVDVVEALTSDRANEALDVRVLPGRSRCGEDLVGLHRGDGGRDGRAASRSCRRCVAASEGAAQLSALRSTRRRGAGESVTATSS
jgi:hypothetical protein